MKATFKHQVEADLLSRVIELEEVEALVKAGIEPEYFVPDVHRAVCRFLLDYWAQHDVTPGKARVLEFCPEFIYRSPKLPLEDCFERFWDYRRRLQVEDVTGRLYNALKVSDYTAAFDVLESAGPQLQVQGQPVVAADYYASLREAMAKIFEEKSGIVGIPTGFPSLDSLTCGLRPGQLVTIGGRFKSGKSTLLLLMATAAQQALATSAFLTLEMDEDDHFARYISLNAGIDYDHITKRCLTLEEKQKGEEFLEMARETVPIYFIPDASRMATVRHVERFLAQINPAILFIDGVYMMRSDNPRASDWERISNIVRNLKQLAMRKKIPIVLSSQASASRTKAGHYEMDFLAYSSVFSEESDLVLALMPSKMARRMVLKVVAARRCAAGLEIPLYWDWPNHLICEDMEDV